MWVSLYLFPSFFLSSFAATAALVRVRNLPCTAGTNNRDRGKEKASLENLSHSLCFPSLLLAMSRVKRVWFLLWGFLLVTSLLPKEKIRRGKEGKKKKQKATSLHFSPEQAPNPIQSNSIQSNPCSPGKICKEERKKIRTIAAAAAEKVEEDEEALVVAMQRHKRQQRPFG